MLPLLSRRVLTTVAALVLLLNVAPPHALAKEASRLRILLVIDTDATGAADFGASHDRDNMQAALGRSLKTQNLRYTMDVLQGAHATPQRVLGYYERMQSNADEAFLFYYTGHGSMVRGKGQVLTMKHGDLDRSRLRSAMTKRNPRLAVILTDCCSSGMSENEAIPSEGPAPKSIAAAKASRSGSVVRDLFFRHEGLVVVGAAKVGQTANGTRSRGSHFTVALTQLMNAAPGRFDQNKDGFVEWREFFPALRQETQRVSGAAKTPHTPQAFFLGHKFGG
jgi:hypothetical protein